MNASTGKAFALNAATGATLWSTPTGGSCNNGPSIVDGVVYWGTGYGVLGAGLGSSNNKLFAFALP
jgi:polyvinyl alcohol dehydrogenase (cytochrome)